MTDVTSARCLNDRVRKAAKEFFVWSQDLLQGVALQADATVAVSPKVAMQLRSRWNFRGEIRMIPNGVVVKTGQSPRDGALDSVSSGEDPLRVIWVGTSGYKKGLDLAVEACRIARSQGQEVSLTVVGMPLKSASAELGFGEVRLTWLVAVPPDDMDALYRCHDVMLFPTRYDPFGLVVLEALSAGLPVIGSGEVQWLIEDAGEVIVGEDTGAYAEALRALADPDRRRQLSKVALERAQAFTWESSAAGYLGVLNVMGRQRG